MAASYDITGTWMTASYDITGTWMAGSYDITGTWQVLMTSQAYNRHIILNEQ